MTFGEALRRARESKRLSVVACAEAAGVQASQWSRAEADEPKRSNGLPPIPSVRTVEKYITGLNLNLAFDHDRELLRSIYAQTPYSIKEPIWTEESSHVLNDEDAPVSPHFRRWVEQFESLPEDDQEEIGLLIQIKSSRNQGKAPLRVVEGGQNPGNKRPIRGITFDPDKQEEDYEHLAAYKGEPDAKTAESLDEAAEEIKKRKASKFVPRPGVGDEK